MKLASLKAPSRDGRLVVVSRDLRYACGAESIAPTLQAALDRWSDCAPQLQALYADLCDGRVDNAFAFDPAAACAPLPRAYQWCDGSAFLNHGELMEKALGLPPIPDQATVPLMYQGASDDFLGPHDNARFTDEAQGIDFEGEYGVILGDVPMASAAAALEASVLLVVQINDFSLRAFAAREMRTGFGFVHSKPSTSFAPVAVTPDELGDAWRDGRVQLPLHIEWNGERFGEPDGGHMSFSFFELAAHAARTRRLHAGTIIGSGTVSNAGGAAGSACIAERRAIETIASGAPTTGFMRFGDRVRMEARLADGSPLFGAVDQRVVSDRDSRQSD